MPRTSTYHSIWSRGARVSGPIGTGGLFVALAFKFTSAGKIVAFQFLHDTTDGENHIGWLLHQPAVGVVRVEAAGNFIRHTSGTKATGWEVHYLHPWINVVVGDLYELVVFFGNAKYSDMIAARSPDPDVVVGPITVPGAASGVTNGLTATTQTFVPGTSLGGAKPALDILFHKKGDP